MGGSYAAPATPGRPLITESGARASAAASWETGGFRARWALDKPFRMVARATGLEKRVAPRAMRRTFRDLARAAEVNDLVTRAIDGHATESMQKQ